VAVAVLAVDPEDTGDVVHFVGPPAEVRVHRPDARVDDVGVHAGGRGCPGICAGQRERGLVDPVEAPGVAVRVHLLRVVHVDDVIGLDVGDVGVVPQRDHRGIREARREALERTRIGVPQRAAMRGDERPSEAPGIGYGVVEYDDVLPRHRLGGGSGA